MLRRVISLVAGLLAVFISGGAYAQTVCQHGSSYNVDHTKVVFLWSYSGGAFWAYNSPVNPQDWLNTGWTVETSVVGSDPCSVSGTQRWTAGDNRVTTFLIDGWTRGGSPCPAGQIANPSGGCMAPAPVVPAWSDVQNGVTQYLKGFSFSGAAQSAGLGAGQLAYDAAVAAGKTAEQALQAGTDAAYLSAVTYTKDNETSSIMSRAILSGVAAAGVVAALPAFLVGGSLAAAASLAVATVAAGGVAIDAIQSTPSGAAVASSASSTPVNVRLSDSSPSLSGVAQLKLVESYFVPDVSLSSLGDAAFVEQSDGTLKSTSAAGVTTLSADKTTVTTQSGSVTTKVQATTATVNNVPQQVVVKTVTAPVQTDAGQATASVSTVYDKTGSKLTGDVVALTDAVSNGVRSSVTADNSLSTGSGGSGSSIASQFPSSSIASGTTTGAGGSFGGAGASGTFCGGVGQEPCAMDLLTPSAPFQVAQTAKDSNSQFWGSLETSGKDKLTNIATSGDQNGLLTWAMIPLPSTGSCSDPVLSFAGHTIALTGFCDRMAMIRLALEYFLYLTTVFYVFKLASESSTTV